MKIPRLLAGSAAIGSVLSLAIACANQAAAATPGAFGFVQRTGTTLTLAGKPYRFGGMDIEFLGLEYFGVTGPAPQHTPTLFEVNDALATAQDMGSRVVRSQTLGDTVGCSDCIEPSPGNFNEAALRHIDAVVVDAALHGIRLVFTLTGDCVACTLPGSTRTIGINQYLTWFGDTSVPQFFTDPRIVADFELHIKKLLTHRNVYTGIAYKDDPTILGWENCNLCGIDLLISGVTDYAPYVAWVQQIGAYIKSIDRNHLYIDETGIYRADTSVLDQPSVDLVSTEYYPHFDSTILTRFFGLHTNAALFQADAALAAAHGRAFAPLEVGWDTTNWQTEDDLVGITSTVQQDPNLSGNLYWDLLPHAPDHGWSAIPNDATDPVSLTTGESGQWWAMYYTGRTTLVNPAADMAARAQILRAQFYGLAGRSVPAHLGSPPPLITSLDGNTLHWRGAAGAYAYTVQTAPTPFGPYNVQCDRCLNDNIASYTVPRSKAPQWVRLVAFNLDDKPSLPSFPVLLLPAK